MALLALPSDRAPAGWHLDLVAHGTWVALACLLAALLALTVTALLGARSPKPRPGEVPPLVMVLATFLLDVHFVAVVPGSAVGAGVSGGTVLRSVSEVGLWLGFALSLPALLGAGLLGLRRFGAVEGWRRLAAGAAVVVAGGGALPLIVLWLVAIRVLLFP